MLRGGLGRAHWRGIVVGELQELVMKITNVAVASPRQVEFARSCELRLQIDVRNALKVAIKT
jgi:hypothetical protein